MINEHIENLEVSIDEIVNLEVLIIISPRVEQGLSHLDPSHVTDEFKDGKNRNVNVWRVTIKWIRGRKCDVEVGKDIVVKVFRRWQYELVREQRCEQI
jgi:hypothetical protein